MPNISLILFAIIATLAVVVQGQLLASDYPDGPCTYPPPAANFSKILPLFGTPQVYVSYFMSTSCALRYAQTFLGRPANNWTEVGTLCYNIAFAETLALQSGYIQRKAFIDHAVPNTSYPLGVFSFQDTISKSAGVDTSNQDTTLQTTVWSDGVKHALTVSCITSIPSPQQQWLLYSVGEPDQWAKDIVLGLIQNTTLNLSMDPALALDFTAAEPKFAFTCYPPPELPLYTTNVLITLGLLPASFENPNVYYVANTLAAVYNLLLTPLRALVKIILPLIPTLPTLGGFPLLG